MVDGALHLHQLPWTGMPQVLCALLQTVSISEMTTLEDMQEACDVCGDELEIGQIGICGFCAEHTSHVTRTESAPQPRRWDPLNEVTK
jgi:predicted amidophosphoribosyltransferase